MTKVICPMCLLPFDSNKALVDHFNHDEAPSIKNALHDLHKEIRELKVGKPVVVQVAKPVVQTAGKKFAGNADKKHIVIERATRKAVYVGNMIDCQTKLKELKSAKYAMTLFRA